MVLVTKIHKLLEGLQTFDFFGLFLLRIYLFFVLWYASTHTTSAGPLDPWRAASAPLAPIARTSVL